MEIPPRIQNSGSEDHCTYPWLVDAERRSHSTSVTLDWPRFREGGARVGYRREHVEGEHALREWRMLVPKTRPARQQPLAARVLHPEPSRRNRELLTR